MEITCWNCGEPATTTRTIVHKDGMHYRQSVSLYCRCYCEECREETERRDKEERAQYIRLKKREMFRKACDILESQHTNMYEYKDSIEVAEDYIEAYPDKFDSSYEVLAAIILVQNMIPAKMQYKVGRYQVDFLLEELHIVLEIDCERHKNKKEYDTERDRYLKKELGSKWEIIRIPTELLDKNAKKLPEAIRKVAKYRKTGKVNWRELYPEE